MANATQVTAPKISLLVAEAAEPQAFVMPSFVGQALGSVNRALQDAGFRLGNVNVAAPVSDTASASIQEISSLAASAQTSEPAQATPASIIVSQVPAAGQKVFAGTAVNFEVR